MNSEERIQFVIADHNEICSTIQLYNRFCSKLFFSFISIFAASRFTLTFIFKTNYRYIVWTCALALLALLTWSFTLFVTFMLSSETKSVHSSLYLISHLQWQLQEDRLNLKLKLQSTFERTIERKRIVGFSVLDIFTISFFWLWLDNPYILSISYVCLQLLML